jgi:DNA-binding response OmpR family regulator
MNRLETVSSQSAPVAATQQAGKILVVEDDARMRKVLERLFGSEGYEVLLAGDGLSGSQLFQKNYPLAVVLDMVLPQLPGRELCRQIKALSPETPVLMLSAVTEVADKVLLFELGADDYITKPFSPRELLARVQAAIRRRARGPAKAVYQFGECEVDFAKMTVQRKGEAVVLTAHEMKLLKFFVENAERVLGREELLNLVWGYHAYPTTRTVDNQILKLRQKLEPDPAHPRHLLTIYGAGYKFVP